jgi:hypothetical protein
MTPEDLNEAESSNGTAACAVSHAVPCSACEARVIEWLTGHTEAWFGPKTKWSKRQKDKFFEELSLLTLFAQDFRFPEQNETSPVADANE